jgi:hypothetical protein
LTLRIKLYPNVIWELIEEKVVVQLYIIHGKNIILPLK